MESNFDKLLTSTVNHLKEKKYLFKPIITKKRRDGSEIINESGNPVLIKTNPTPHKNVMLSIAFNIALKNYTNIRPVINGNIKNNQFSELKLSEVSDMLLRYFSNKFIDKIGEATLIDIKQNYQYEAIERFRKIEYKLFATIDRFRNYHSHYVHEPGILRFEDLFSNVTMSTEDFEEVKKWFEEKFDIAKNHLVSSLTNKDRIVKEKIKSAPESGKYKTDSEEIEKTLKRFESLRFLEADNTTISLNGELFIACMFLYKRQVKIVLERWRDFRLDKELIGYGNSIHTFFTYYCLSESYSLNNFNNDLLKFRDITSKLTTIPFSSNSQLEPIYTKIREINELNYKNIETTKNFKTIKESIEKQKINLQNASRDAERTTLSQYIRRLERELNAIRRNNRDKVKAYEEQENIKNAIILLKSNYNSEVQNKIKMLYEVEIRKNEFALEDIDFQNKIMPIRRRNILTNVLLRYLFDNKLLGQNFKVAIAKTSVDRTEYFEKYKYDGICEAESLETLKNKIKAEKNSDVKNKLREHYKELKRNFIFKTPEELESLSKPTTYKVTENEGEEYEVTKIKGFKFINKAKNALFQYSFAPDGHKEIVINVVISPQLLMKWVFVHLTRKDNNGLVAIQRFLDLYINKLVFVKDIDSVVLIKEYLKTRGVRIDSDLTREFIQEINNKGHNLNKIFPRSIMQSAGLRGRQLNTKDTLRERVNKLEIFFNTNRLQPKPWTYESKKKIDLILEYLHFKLLEDVYINKIHQKEDLDEETFLRHNYFSIDDYDIVRQYFRYFGRYESKTYDELKIYGTKKFVMPQLIKEAKEKYALIFEYIADLIERSSSLESIFEWVINKYINDLNSLLKSRADHTDETLYKVLKIDTGSVAENVNKNLTTHYLRSIALSEEVISVQELCKNELRTIIDSRSKNGKPQNYSDFSYMRSLLQEQNKVTTNADYILKHIVPGIEFENLKEGKSIPNSVLKKLLKIKTEELILWSIAKTYWYNANSSEYVLNNYLKNSDSSSFQVFTTFNKVYKQNLEYVIKIKPDFWNSYNLSRFKKIIDENPDIVKKTIEIRMQVPAKRYDNQFLGVETKLITEYCLWNHCKNSEIVLPSDYTYVNGRNVHKKLNLQIFDDLIKIIHIELNKSLGYIGALLVAEKKLVDSHSFDTIGHLTEKYKGREIKDFYLTISDKDMTTNYSKAIFESFMNCMDEGSTDKPDIQDYLVRFRNFALHYQLQDPFRSKKIDGLLKKINQRITNADLHTLEENIKNG
jgi:hypothetical protein